MALRELADVPGPAIGLQPLHRLGRNAPDTLSELGVVGVDELVHEARDIIGSCA